MVNSEKTGPESIETHAVKLETPAWALAAAKAQYRWVEGEEMTEGDYRAAIQDITSLEVR